MLAAYTGARRSELVRSRLDDLDFHSGMIRIREKKRSREFSLSYRYVPMTQQLSGVLEMWLKQHPGGQNTLMADDGTEVTAKMANWSSLKKPPCQRGAVLPWFVGGIVGSCCAW